MSLKIKLLCVVFICFLGINTIDAQETTTEKFVGVWTPSNKGWIGNIKISVKEGKLFVQMKTDEGLKQANNVMVNGNEITWSFVDETNYGKWYLGMWTWVSTGKSELCILVDNGDGTHGTNGAPTRIIKRGQANREVSYWGFKGVLKDDNLELGSKHYGEYYRNEELMFEQSSNYILYSTFTNW